MPKSKSNGNGSTANGHSSSPYGGLPDPLLYNRLEELVANATLGRRELLTKLLDPRRDIDDECGYPRTETPVGVETYQQLYDREAVAARVVEVLSKETWQVQPTVYEDEDVETATEFEEAWDLLGQQLRGENSWYQDEEGSVLWEYLKRADILSGIGHYGVILIGVDDGKELSDPVEPNKGRKLLFLRCFPESLAQITQFDDDYSSPRFGQPVRYSVTFNDPRSQHAGIGITTATKDVHWSRVVHLADNLSSSEIFGVPRMRPVLNRLLDLRKIYAADGEAFWRGAIMKLFLETHPQLGGDVDVDAEGLRDSFENMMNGLQQWMFLRGMSAKSVPPQTVEPTGHVNAQIEAICIQLAVPVRVFKGSERGELASSQDDAAWNDRLRARQQDYVTPRVIVPFVDRLISMGVLPEPEGFSVDWPDLDSQTDAEKAQVAAVKTQSLAQYVSGQIETVMPPMDYLTRILGLEEDEAAAILEGAAAATEEEMLTVQPAPAEVSGEPVAPDEYEREEEEDPFAANIAWQEVLPEPVEVEAQEIVVDLSPVAEAIKKQTEQTERLLHELAQHKARIELPPRPPVAFRIETLGDGFKRLVPEEMREEEG